MSPLTSPKPPYTSILIQPPDEYGACEVWGSQVTVVPGLGEFDGDGIIGFIYCLSPYWVFLNDHGHPRRVFNSIETLNGWLTELSGRPPTWSGTYCHAEDR